MNQTNQVLLREALKYFYPNELPQLSITDIDSIIARYSIIKEHLQIAQNTSTETTTLATTEQIPQQLPSNNNTVQPGFIYQDDVPHFTTIVQELSDSNITTLLCNAIIQQQSATLQHPPLAYTNGWALIKANDNMFSCSWGQVKSNTLKHDKTVSILDKTYVLYRRYVSFKHTPLKVRFYWVQGMTL